MDSVPDGIIEHILSHMSNVRDIAASNCVSRRWRDSVPRIPTLYFPRNFLDGYERAMADVTVGRMISAAVCLEELIIYRPFSAASLTSWLSQGSRSLRRLELRMDSINDKKADDVEAEKNKMDCIESVKGLESLKLWGVCLTRTPKWSTFEKLLTLEIVGASMWDGALLEALRFCPNLIKLAFLGCEGAQTVRLELSRLENCRLDFLGLRGGSLSISSPRLQVLEAQGFCWIHVNHNHRLRSLSISKASGRLCKVDIGKLEGLESLSLRGVQWSWNALNSILQCATEVKHLVMKVEFCGGFDKLLPFPQVDLVEFFNNHTKLCYFEIHGAMFAALCQKDSLRNLDSNFRIPCLEEAIITVRSPLNAEQKLTTLESLVKHSQNLKNMVIRISQMRNCQDIADDFFEEVWKFAYINRKVVRIE